MKNITKSISFLFIIIFITTIFSCTKNDEELIIISFIKPSVNAHYSIGDTVIIQVKTDAEKSINYSVSFDIVNLEGIPINTKKSTVSYNSSNGVFEGELILADRNVESGDFKVHCMLNNGDVLKHKYLSITISELTKELLDIVILSTSNNKTDIISIGKSFIEENVLFSLNSNYYKFQLHLPYSNQFVVSGNYQGNAYIWDYDTKDLVKEIASLSNPPFPYFTGIADVSNKLALMYYSGKIEFYYPNGLIKNTVSVNNNYYPSKIMNFAQDFAVIEKSISNNADILSFHHGSTGATYATFSKSIIDLFYFDNGEAITFSNTSNGIMVEMYIKDLGGFATIFNYNSISTVLYVEQVDKNSYLLATLHELYLYRYDISSITEIVNNIDISCMKFDKTTNSIYTLDAYRMSKYSYPDGNLLFSHYMNNAAFDFQLIYNK